MNKNSVTVVDYGSGNILSIKRSLEHFGAKVEITESAKRILQSERLILPGVGAFPSAMRAIKSIGIYDSLKEYATLGRPMLAICLGMQLLMESSSEFVETEGLGIIEGTVDKIPDCFELEQVKVPHIGWNVIEKNDKSDCWNNSPLRGVPNGAEMYFVHSYVVHPKKLQNKLAISFTNGFEICAAISKEFITGVQFHPEKSGSLGLKIIENFLKD